MNTQPGINGLPKILLTSSDGATAEIYLHGAHVTSWILANGNEKLFLSPKAEFGAGRAIRGGAPIIFPQFAEMGTLPKHGFARNLPWTLKETAGNRATFTFSDNDQTRLLWPYAFAAEYQVEVNSKTLTMTLSITNTDNKPFTFTAALHTYLRVNGVRAASISGLRGLRYSDAAAGGIEAVQENDRVAFPAEVDRVYFQTPRTIHLHQKEETLAIHAEGFNDAVIWNPGAVKCAQLKDMEPEGYRQFVCVESATIGMPIHLDPGERWQGTQILAPELP